MQLELGDVLGGRDMSLSTLLALQQSPLLWAAYGTLPAQKEPTPEPQPETPEPQPQPEDNTPQPENSLTEGLTFADNVAETVCLAVVGDGDVLEHCTGLSLLHILIVADK